MFFIGQFDHFPCGAHLISDGSEIFFRAKPLSGQVANVANCNNVTPVELCLDANDLTEKESCTLSASDFTITEITTTEIFDQASQLFDDLDITNISEGITEFKKDELPEGQ